MISLIRSFPEVTQRNKTNTFGSTHERIICQKTQIEEIDQESEGTTRQRKGKLNSEQMKEHRMKRNGDESVRERKMRLVSRVGFVRVVQETPGRVEIREGDVVSGVGFPSPIYSGSDVVL